MLRAEVDAYAPQFRQAILSLNADSQYYHNDDLQLGKTADTEPWIPSEDVKRLVPRAGDIPITSIDETTDLTKVLHLLVNEVHVGLVLMGEQYGRFKRPAIIVMTTSIRYFTIDPNFDIGIDFLRRCLQVPGLYFWTINGMKDAECLLRQYNISLRDCNSKDCSSLHLHMMKALMSVPSVDDARDKRIYPERAIKQAKRQKKLEKLEKLAYIWLDLNDTRNIELDPSQLKHLNRRPLSLTAENLIRKRCALVICLAMKLMYYAHLEFALITDNGMNMIINTHSDRALKALRRLLVMCEKNKIVPKTYFAHIDRICF